MVERDQKCIETKLGHELVDFAIFGLNTQSCGMGHKFYVHKTQKLEQVSPTFRDHWTSLINNQSTKTYGLPIYNFSMIVCKVK